MSGRIIVFIIVAALIFTGLNLYVGSRIFQWLEALFPGINKAIFICIYVFIALTLILGNLPLPAALKGLLGWISSHWLGAFLYLLLFFLAADLCWFTGKALKLIPAALLQHIRFCFSTLAVLLAMAVVCYGLYNANQTKTVFYDISINKSMPAAMKIVFIADLHLGGANSEQRLAGIVQKINGLHPDIVCIAGDIFNDDYYSIRNPEAASAAFKSIEAAYGVYACFGNHDGGKSIGEMMDFLQRSNIRLLNDEYVVIDERLVVAGRLDSSPIRGFGGLHRKNFSEVTARLDTDLPLAVLDHNPANIGQYGGEVDLILCGHTHRGQLFPGSIVTGRMYTVDYGYYQKDANSPQCLVTQGVGVWMIPMRVGSSNEIVCVTLH